MMPGAKAFDHNIIFIEYCRGTSLNISRILLVTGLTDRRKKSVKDDNLKHKAQKAAEKRMQEYLEQLQKTGAEFFVDGEAVLPTEAVNRTLREESVYMADYILGESGKIAQIRFDKIEL